MANEFKVKNGLIVIGDLTTSGTITINGALAATQSWVTSQGYLTSASLSGYATQSYVTSAIAALVDSAPAALDTLNELAAALGDDANFSTTITTSIGNKVSKSGDTMTGDLTLNYGYPRINFYDSNHDSDYALINNDGGFSLYDITNNVHRWWVTSGGNVGIGTTSPIYKLHVAGSTYVNGGTLFLDSGEYLRWGNSNQGIVGVNDSHVAIVSGGSTRQTIYADGRTYFPGLDLSISNVNSTHGTGNYFRGDGSHFVLGTSGTLYLNYGGSTTNITGTTYINGNLVWHAGNDGTGSTLDADLLDGFHASQSGGGSVVLTTASNGYLYVNNWIHPANGTGLFYDSGPHFYESGGQMYSSHTLRVNANILITDGADNNRFQKGSNWLNLRDPWDNVHLRNSISGYGIYTDATIHYWRPHDGSNNYMTLSSTGLGIGTSSPSAKLHVNGTFISNAFWTNSSSIAFWGAHDTAYGGLTWDTGQATVYATSGNKLYLASNGSSPDVTIATNGDVGIGTTSPGQKLSVAGNIETTTGTGIKIGFNVADSFTAYGNSVAHYGISYNYSSYPLALSGYFGVSIFTNGLERVTIGNGGAVGIGITSPGYKLHVNGYVGFVDSLYANNKKVLDTADGWLRLNQDGNFASGVYTPYVLRNDGEFINYGGIYGYNTIRGRKSQTNNLYTSAALWTESYDNTTTGIAFHISGNVGKFLEMRTDGILYWDNAPVITTANVGSQSVASATTSTSTYRGIIEDTRAAERTPNDYDDYRVSWEFTNQITGLSGWKSVMTMQGWHNNYAAWQLIGGSDTSINENWYLRSGNATTWSAVRRIWHDGDFTSTNVSNWNTAYGWGNHASAGYATTSYVTTQINNLINGAPGALDTLDELAAALGDDANFATTVTNSIAGKVSKSGDTMTGDLVIGVGASTSSSQPFGDFSQLRFDNLHSDTNRGPNKIVMHDNGGTWIGGFGIHSDTVSYYTGGFHRWYKTTSQTSSDQVMQLDPAGNLSVTGTFSASGYNSSNWNTAYGWGNHASAGYASASSLANYLPLAGGTMSGSINMNGNNVINIGQVNATHAIFTNDGSSRVMYIRGSGNIIQFQDASANNKWEVVGRDGEFYIYKNDGTGTGYKWRIDTVGNHAITGAVSLSSNLNVAGELAFLSGGGSYTNIIRSAAYPSEGYPAGQNYWIEYRAQGGHHFVLNTDGGVGSGANTMDDFVIWQGAIDGNRLLEVSNIGNLWIAGALTEASSLKLKENVETSEGNLEKVVNLRPVTYNKIGSQTTELGLIAEEVAEIYPQFVQYDENGEPIGVHYSRLTAALIGAVKELTKRIETLENNG